MPIDVSIYQQALRSPPSVQDFLGQLQQRDLQQGQLDQNRLALASGQQKLDEYQRETSERNALREALSSGQIDLSTPEGMTKGFAVAPTQFGPIAKSAQDRMTAKALANKDQSIADDNAYGLRIKKADKAISDITSLATPEDAIKSLNAHHANGDVDDMKYQSVLSTLQPALQNPQAFGQWKRQMIMGILDAKDRIAATAPKVAMANAGGSLVPVNENADAGPVGPMAGAAPIPVTQTADNRANNATSRANNAANIGKDFAIAGLGPDGKDTGGGTGGLSPAAIEAGAARYLVDGTLPTNVGRGAQGARDIRKMLNRAGELAVGIDPTQQRINQLDAKSAGAALTQLTKAKTMAGAFEDTANQNAELALSLSKKNDRTGSPLLNEGLQAYRTGTGIPGALQFNASPEASQFAASVDTFTGEYAKIMSGGMGNGPVSDAARNKASHLLSTSMTPQAFEGNVKLLQTEMRNRMKGFEDTEKTLRTRLSGGAKTDTSSADSGAQAPPVFKITHIDGKPQ